MSRGMRPSGSMAMNVLRSVFSRTVPRKSGNKRVARAHRINNIYFVAVVCQRLTPSNATAPSIPPGYNDYASRLVCLEVTGVVLRTPSPIPI